MTISNIDTPDEMLQKHKKLMLVFSATWCGPCQALKRNLENIKAGLPEDMHLAVIDWDEYGDFAMKYNVKSIPTVAIFKDGELAHRVTGVHTPSHYHEIVSTIFLS